MLMYDITACTYAQYLCKCTYRKSAQFDWHILIHISQWTRYYSDESRLKITTHSNIVSIYFLISYTVSIHFHNNNYA